MHDRIFGFGSVSVIFSGFGEYSVSAEYLSNLTETEHLYFLLISKFLWLFTENPKYINKRKIQFIHKYCSNVSFYKNLTIVNCRNCSFEKFWIQGYWLENQLFKVRFRFGFGDFSIFGFGFGSIMKSWVRSCTT